MDKNSMHGYLQFNKERQGTDNSGEIVALINLICYVNRQKDDCLFHIALPMRQG